MRSKAENVKKGFIWGFLYRASTILFPFIVRTVFIHQLGSIYLGLNSLFSSILSFLNLAELGIGSAMVYSMYKPIAQKDTTKICALLNLYQKVYRIIGCVILGLGIFITPFLNYIISGDVPQDINIHIVYLIYLVNTSLSYFLYAYKQSILIAEQRLDILNIVHLCVGLMQYAFQIMVLLVAKDYYLYILIMVINTIANNIIVQFITKLKYPQYRSDGTISADELSVIVNNVKALFVSKIGGVLRSSADNIVISAFLGLLIVGQYNNYYYIVSSIMMIFGIIMEALTPSIGNMLIYSDSKKNKESFTAFNFIYVWLVTIASILFLCLCDTFIVFWVGQENRLDFSIVILLTLYLYVHKFCDMLAVYQDAAGTWKATKWVPLYAAIVNLTINIALVILIGLPGVIISTIISVLFVYDIGYSRVLFRILFNETRGAISYFFKQIYLFILGIVVAAVAYYVCGKINFSSMLLQLALRFIVSGLISLCGCTLLFMIHPDYKIAKQFLKDQLRKQK